MRNVMLSILSALLYTSATCNGASIQRRDSENCADPDLATDWVESFSPSLIAHIISPITRVVDVDSDSSAGRGDWQIQSDAFLVWQAEQPYTTALYEFFNSDIKDYTYLIAKDYSPPTLAGYKIQGIVGYVYATQVCNSVPILSAFKTSTGDHWYTTSKADHQSLLDKGWVDKGVIAYALPFKKP